MGPLNTTELPKSHRPNHKTPKHHRTSNMRPLNTTELPELHNAGLIGILNTTETAT